MVGAEVIDKRPLSLAGQSALKAKKLCFAWSRSSAQAQDARLERSGNVLLTLSQARSEGIEKRR